MSDDFSRVHAATDVTSSSDASAADTLQVRGDDQALLESLSALMDDQADELELRRILKAMPNNPELQRKWQRFHAVRSSLQQEIHSDPAVSLVAGINAHYEFTKV